MPLWRLFSQSSTSGSRLTQGLFKFDGPSMTPDRPSDTTPSDSSPTGTPSRSLLERTGFFGLSIAMLVLMGFFFILPSAFRGARVGLKNKENDVKDWLPSDFPETAELDWFADHFAGESFVLATWPGCNVGDQRLRLLEEKLLHESSQYRDHLTDPGNFGAPDPGTRIELTDEERRGRIRARSMGDELGLLQPGQPLDDWGGRQEKWLVSADGTWYFVTPDGRLYRWDEPVNGPAGLWRSIQKRLGLYELKGQLVTAFGKPSTDDRINEFYNDPSLLCAPLFQTVQTGATIAEELAAEGGPLWPVDLTDPESRPRVAQRRALDRLTGTLFAPAVPQDFAWTPDAFATAMGPDKAAALPTGWQSMVTRALDDFVASQWPGDPAVDASARLTTATTQVQTDAWRAVFDELAVEPPPRLTCLLVTLTDIGKDNLSYAIGRGVMGMPRGRLLELAAQCGVHPPSPPSTAPPPFDREPPETIGGLPPLRMGGPPVDNIAIDEEGTVTLARLVGYCILLGVVLSYVCFRSFKVTLMLFLVGGSSAMLAMAVVGWTGGRVDAILLSMPSLVYVLGLSGAIHVINYYRDEVRLRGRRGAATRALQHAILPCTLAALTTAIGLASLFTSNLRPISNFGLYSALGVISTLGVLFSYLPAALEVFAPRFAGETEDSETAAAKPTVANPSGANELEPTQLANWWAAVGRWITAHHASVSVGCIVILALASLGLFKIRTSVQLLKLFDAEARILRDYAWLEDNFGKLVPMEILVRMPPEIQHEWNAGPKTVDIAADDDASSLEGSPIQLTLLERIETITRIRTAVTRTLGEEGMDVVGQASSMDTFLPPLPDVSNRYSVLRSNFERQLADGKPEMLKSDYVKTERSGPMVGSELWRLSLRVSALSDVDYGLFINDLKLAVSPVMQAYAVRAAILDRLADDDGVMSGKQRILVLGSGEIGTLATADLVVRERPNGDNPAGNNPADNNPADNNPADNGELATIRIDQRALFLSTLHELLGNERIKTPIWIDPADPNAKIKPGDAKWDAFLAAMDLIIDVRGLGQSTQPESVASISPVASLPGIAENVVLDARAILAKETSKTILEMPTGSDGPRRIPLFGVSRPDTPQVVFTGVVPVVYKAQRTLLGSLVESIMLAFVLIGIVMVVLLNPGPFPVGWLQPGYIWSGVAAGAVSMIPNIFPVLLVFGMMGHLNSMFTGRFMVDIGTMMTASVAMGVAVDDTIHFLSWFRQFLDEGKSRVEAVIETYRRVGPAMTQTTIVGGLGLFIFALSTFTPTQRFGTLMLVMLAAALIGDLVLLPALLAGPLGRFFKPRAGSVGAKMAAGEPIDSRATTSSTSDDPDPRPDPNDSPNGPSGHVPTSPADVDALPPSIATLKLHRPPSRTDAGHITRRK